MEIHEKYGKKRKLQSRRMRTTNHVCSIQTIKIPSMDIKFPGTKQQSLEIISFSK